MTKKWNTFHAACALGILKDAKKMYEDAKEKGEDLALLRDNDGWTCLHISCLAGNIELVEYLLNDANVDINAVGNGGETALHIAAEKCSLELNYLLLSTVFRREADAAEAEGRPTTTPQAVGARDARGRTVLHRAALGGAAGGAGGGGGGQLFALQLYAEGLDGRAPRALVDPGITDNDGQNALNLAIEMRHKVVVEYLLGRFPELEASTRHQQQLLRSHPELRAAGAAVQRRQAQRRKAARALGAVAREGDAAGVEALLAQCTEGPRVRAELAAGPGGAGGRSALMEAAAAGQVRAVRALLAVPGVRAAAAGAPGEEGPGLVEARCRKGLTALQWAVKHNRGEAARVLVGEGGADAGVRTRRGEGLGAFARYFGHLELAHALEQWYPGEGEGEGGGASGPGGLQPPPPPPPPGGSPAKGRQVSQGSGAGEGVPPEAAAAPPPPPFSPAAAPFSPSAAAPLPPPPPLPRATSALSAATHDSSSHYEEDLLSSWLASLHLGRYEGALRESGFDTLMLLTTVTEADLDEMGFKKGHKRAFMVGKRGLARLEAPDLERLQQQLAAPGGGGGAGGGGGGGSVSSADHEAQVAAQLGGGGGGGGGGREAVGPGSPDLGALPPPAMGSAAAEEGEPYAPASALGLGPGSAQASARAEDAGGAPLKELEHAELDLQEVIGEGSFGVVRRARWRGMDVAVKELKMNTLLGGLGVLGGSEDDLHQEARVLSRVCNHNCVVQLVGVTFRPVCAVVTRYMPKGSVEDVLLRRREPVGGARGVARMAMEAAQGVAHLHREGVIHRDLAARNLLVDDHLRVRVSDFGFARVKDACASRGYTRTEMGPIKWTAPEAMRRKVYSESSDVFSFGVVLFEMFAREPPWRGLENLDVAVRVCSGERMPLPHDMDPNITNLIKKCWAEEPCQRPGLTSIIEYLDFLAKEGFPDGERTHRRPELVLWGQEQKTRGVGHTSVVRSNSYYTTSSAPKREPHHRLGHIP